jgi:hypothetical protein
MFRAGQSPLLPEAVSSKYEGDKDLSRSGILRPEFLFVFGVLLRRPKEHLERGHRRE